MSPPQLNLLRLLQAVPLTKMSWRFQKQLQQRQSDTMRKAARQLEAERAQKKQIETQLTEERKAAEERLEREKRDLLMRSTADFHRMREMVATPGQVFSPDGMDDPDVLQSPSLRESVERTESSERHKIETSELAERNRELERKLADKGSGSSGSQDAATKPSTTGESAENDALLKKLKADKQRHDVLLNNLRTFHSLDKLRGEELETAKVEVNKIQHRSLL